MLLCSFSHGPVIGDCASSLKRDPHTFIVETLRVRPGVDKL